MSNLLRNIKSISNFQSLKRFVAINVFPPNLQSKVVNFTSSGTSVANNRETGISPTFDQQAKTDVLD